MAGILSKRGGWGVLDNSIKTQIWRAPTLAKQLLNYNYNYKDWLSRGMLYFDLGL